MNTILSENTIHVYHAVLYDLLPYRQYYLSILSRKELERERKYHFRKDRLSFSIRRGVLRLLLAEFLDTDPTRITYRTTPNGKLYLDGQRRPHQNLSFNLSSSESVALFAFALHREVGIDIEFHHPQVEWEAIADRHFSGREKKELAVLPKHLTVQGFYNGWTRKEAYIKALGHGLSVTLEQFEVSLAPHEPARLLPGQSLDTGIWQLTDLTLPFKNYTAALAYEGSPCSLAIAPYKHSPGLG